MLPSLWDGTARLLTPGFLLTAEEDDAEDEDAAAAKSGLTCCAPAETISAGKATGGPTPPGSAEPFPTPSALPRPLSPSMPASCGIAPALAPPWPWPWPWLCADGILPAGRDNDDADAAPNKLVPPTPPTPAGPDEADGNDEWTGKPWDSPDFCGVEGSAPPAVSVLMG